jgi:hypothetical protein
MINPPVAQNHIISVGRYWIGSYLLPFVTSGGFNSTVFPATNRAVYYPQQIPVRFTVARFIASNGASVAGTFDIGLFSQSGVKLISTGSQTQTGTSVAQYIDVTDQTFPPGFYYLGMVVSNTASARYNGVTFNDQYEARGTGCLQESLGSAVLPTTMTPASYATSTIYFFGFTQSATL